MGVTLALGACVALKGERGPEGAVQIDSIRKSPPSGIQRIPMTVRIEDLRRAQGNIELNRLRVLKIVLSAGGSSGDDPMPQYRLFDVKPGGVAEVIGLQNADVLVAANGYVVYHPDQFLRYLVSIPLDEETFIEIRRDGRPIMLEYKFIGTDPKPKTTTKAASTPMQDTKKTFHDAEIVEEKDKTGEALLPLALTPLPILNEKVEVPKKAITATPGPKSLKSPAPTPKKSSVSTKKAAKSKNKKKKSK